MLFAKDMKTLQTRPEGRPTKLNDDIVVKLENIFKVGANVEEACSYALINKTTYYRWIKEDEGFATKMEAAQHYSNIVAKNVVVDSIVKDKDLSTAKWWLEKKHPDFQSQNQNVNVQVNNFIPILGKEFKLNVPNNNSDQQDS